MSSNMIDNKYSSILTPDENLQAFKLLGNRCQSMCTTVVQLYCTEPPQHLHWIKKDVGVLCFVKDNMKKNYFFRLLCLRRNAQVWEHEMYNNMEYIESTLFLHIFEGEDTIIAFNFASTDEAKQFKNVVDEKLAIRKRKEERRLRQTREASTQQISLQQQDYRKPVDTAAKLAKRKRNITKADIGNPSDFKHISHVGWNPDSGFDIDVEDPQLRSFFERAGISDKQLQDRDTKEFIYDFINRNGGREAIEQETSQHSTNRRAPAVPPSNNVPPVPPRGSTRTHVRTAPPPPPPIGNHIKSPSTISSSSTNSYSERTDEKSPPPPPPPMANIDSFTAPPPPPPPVMNSCDSTVNSAPPPLSMNAALMESIKSGTTLRPVEDRQIAVIDDSRNNLLSEIRKGTKLKPVEQRVIPTSNQPEPANIKSGNLAEALARALAERSKAIHSEDDDSSSGSNDDEWDD